ncbi:trans-acting enoyl reductase family protein [Phycicoccus sp. Soil748]|uniref:saccharopine dehydrogenase family protein n=1 Tax=Phycicoccus sp. Soil748 TaxID=1736397 RepID=UPI000702C30C|nr:saccharopine dehydrogenase NADP-binding domain-containing protein [Phycicoccus sp. Soil748]KRE55499.1 enoyl-ACP reductase [Phycicoccus sp. Soil748]
MSGRAHDVVVYGATGFVGRLLAEYLAEHAPSGTRIALAGRSRTRLEEARRGLPAAARDWPVLVADATDEAALEELAASTTVVATTVGPYLRYGLPLALACARTGTHYADLTGEVLFVRRVIDACDDLARSTGARIVTACGYDSVPSDLGVHLLHQRARHDAAGALLDTTLHARARGGLSGGTIDSSRAQVEAVEADRRALKVLFDPYALSPERAAEPDLGKERDVTTVFEDAQTGDWVGPFVMAAFNSRIVRRSNALRGHAYGRRFRYREVNAFGRGARGHRRALVQSAALGLAMKAMADPRTRPLVDRLAPSPGQGPSEQTRRTGWFSMTLRTTTETGRRYVATVRAQGDPGYAATAVMLGESALALALDGDRLPAAAGVLTPATAIGDVLVERLRARDFALTVEELPTA